MLDPFCTNPFGALSSVVYIPNWKVKSLPERSTCSCDQRTGSSPHQRNQSSSNSSRPRPNVHRDNLVAFEYRTTSAEGPDPRLPWPWTGSQNDQKRQTPWTRPTRIRTIPGPEDRTLTQATHYAHRNSLEAEIEAVCWSFEASS